MVSGGDPEAGLSAAERERLAEIRAAESLADLVRIADATSEHGAYLAVKPEWRALRSRELSPAVDADGLPGDRVDVDGRAVHVHGITHAGTDAERALVREEVSRFLESGAAVYCEQGIRAIYLSDVPGACAMDDYRWAMARCEELGVDSHLSETERPDAFDGPLEGVAALASTFREAAFSLIESGSGLYGDEYARALGDVASEFLTSHEDVATGRDFRSFRLSREAALDPGRLRELQNYYRAAFLPQPIEREWLRRHDRELELVTHARNERMADYALAHAEDATEVHLLVGAAHHPGVRYYLAAHRDGRRSTDGFELVG